MRPSLLNILIWVVLSILGPLAAWGQETPRMIGMGEDADSVTFDQLKNLGLLLVDVTTVDGEWPTCDYVKSPPAGWGKSITNATKVPGRVRVWRDGVVAYDSGDYLENQSGMTIRIRGNTSAYSKKKPYKIDLQDKGDLLLRNNPSYRDKDWILIRDADFRTLQGLELNRFLGMTWTPAYRYANVVINDEYQGVYLLLESVKRNNNCRLRLNKSGFIFECDAYWWNNKTHIKSTLQPMLAYTFKYPNDDDLTADDLAYMTQLIADYEASVYEGTYDQMIDVNSFATWCLGHDILATFDAAGTNQFYVKNDRTPSSLITMPLMWDFDSTEGNVIGWSRCHREVFSKYFKNANREFVKAYVRKWREVRDSLATSMGRTLQAFKFHGDGPGLLKSLPLNNLRWNGTHLLLGGVDNRIAWFTKRQPWIDQAINALIPAGDVNADTEVDVVDVNLVVNMILELCERDEFADANGDGNVDIEDVNRIISIILADTPPQPVDEIAVMPSQLTMAAEGDTVSVLLQASREWYVELADVPEWLTLSSTEGGAGDLELTLVATPADQERQAVLHFLCGEAIDSLTVTQLAPLPTDTIVPTDTVTVISIADFLSGGEAGECVRLAGVVTDIDTVQQGRFTVRDWSGTVVVNGATELPQFDNLAVGNIVTIQGRRENCNEVPQLIADEIVDLISVTPVAIADCDSLPDSDTVYYRVTGTIGEVLDADLGELLLIDNEGHTLHVVATMPGWGATGDNCLGLLTTLELAVGDTLTVIGTKNTVDDLPQLCNTFYFSHEKSQ